MQVLIESGLKMTDHNVQDEGYEVEISAFKVRLVNPNHPAVFPQRE